MLGKSSVHLLRFPQGCLNLLGRRSLPVWSSEDAFPAGVFVNGLRFNHALQLFESMHTLLSVFISSYLHRYLLKAEEKCDTPGGTARAEDPLWNVNFFSKLADRRALGKEVFFRLGSALIFIFLDISSCHFAVYRFSEITLKLFYFVNF